MSGILIIVALLAGLAVGVGLWAAKRRDEPKRTEIRPDAPTRSESDREAGGET